ncbi:MAG: SpaA isopeptide-forming pilin-related protein, partial [Candidatus Microthrix parvicella]
LAPPGLQSNVTVGGFYDDAFDQKLTDYGFPAPLTSSDGKAYLRVNVVDGTKPVSYGLSIVGPSSARVLRPVDERQQTMIVAGTPKVAQADGRQEAPLGTVRIGKLDGVSGDPVAGATLRLTGPGGYDETFTSTTSLTEIPDVRVGNYRLTETAPPPGYITETPAPTVTGLLDRDAELTLTVDNYREIDGQTKASESVVTSQGDTQVLDEITVTGVDDDQEVEAVCPQCGPTPF